MKLVQVHTPATFLAALTLALLFVPTLLLSHPSPVSEMARRTFLDSQLAAAEDGAVRIARVRRYGGGDFRTVTEAVKSIPSGNRRRVVVWIGMGVYREKVTVDRSKPFVTFYGERSGNDMPTITYDGRALQYGTVDSATVAVDSDYFVAVNVAFAVR